MQLPCNDQGHIQLDQAAQRPLHSHPEKLYNFGSLHSLYITLLFSPLASGLCKIVESNSFSCILLGKQTNKQTKSPAAGMGLITGFC